MLVNYTSKDLDLLARLIRAEALGEGDFGMLMVGNVGINRVIADCLDFRNIRSIREMIYQTPGGFSGKDSPLFFNASTTHEKRLAEKSIRGKTFHPATNALWFYAPRLGESCRATWFNQRNIGRYKGHCFYVPDPGVCVKLY